MLAGAQVSAADKRHANHGEVFSGSIMIQQGYAIATMNTCAMFQDRGLHGSSGDVNGRAIMINRSNSIMGSEEAWERNKALLESNDD